MATISIDYDYNVIYNRAENPINKTKDNEESLIFVHRLKVELHKIGRTKCYDPDVDAIGGRNIFSELFRVLKSSKMTVVVISPGFLENCWSKFSQQASFKHLLEKNHSHKLIPIAIAGVTDNQIPEELYSVSQVIFFGKNLDDPKQWGKVFKAFETSEQAFNNRPSNNRPWNVEEQHDNRQRSEQQGLFIAQPSDERSSLFLDVNSDVNQNNSVVFADCPPEALAGAEVVFDNASALESARITTESGNGNAQLEPNTVITENSPSAAEPVNLLATDDDIHQQQSAAKDTVLKTIKVSPVSKVIARVPVYLEQPQSAPEEATVMKSIAVVSPMKASPLVPVAVDQTQSVTYESTEMKTVLTSSPAPLDILLASVPFTALNAAPYVSAQDINLHNRTSTTNTDQVTVINEQRPGFCNSNNGAPNNDVLFHYQQSLSKDDDITFDHAVIDADIDVLVHNDFSSSLSLGSLLQNGNDSSGFVSTNLKEDNHAVESIAMNEERLNKNKEFVEGKERQEFINTKNVKESNGDFMENRQVAPRPDIDGSSVALCERGYGNRKSPVSFASRVFCTLIGNISRPELAYQGIP